MDLPNHPKFSTLSILIMVFQANQNISKSNASEKVVERPKSALQAGHGPIAVAIFHPVDDPKPGELALSVPATLQAQDAVGAQLEV